jgi:hypothetical protein
VKVVFSTTATVAGDRLTFYSPCGWCGPAHCRGHAVPTLTPAHQRQARLARALLRPLPPDDSEAFDDGF